MTILIQKSFSQAMLFNGMSVAELSRKSGISEGHLHGVLHGRRKMTPRTAAMIAKALGKQPQELFTYE